jgi:hypothetical protein
MRFRAKSGSTVMARWIGRFRHLKKRTQFEWAAPSISSNQVPRRASMACERGGSRQFVVPLTYSRAPFRFDVSTAKEKIGSRGVGREPGVWFQRPAG